MFSVLEDSSLSSQSDISISSDEESLDNVLAVTALTLKHGKTEILQRFFFA